MHCTVYRLRREGEKLPTEEVRAGGVSGWLETGSYMHHPGTQARLFVSKEAAARRDGHYLIELNIPSLGRIKGGILLRGFDGMYNSQKQVWWVVPTPAPPETPPPAPV